MHDCIVKETSEVEPGLVTKLEHASLHQRRDNRRKNDRPVPGKQSNVVSRLCWRVTGMRDEAPGDSQSPSLSSAIFGSRNRLADFK
jgi:hypothetical protein